MNVVLYTVSGIAPVLFLSVLVMAQPPVWDRAHELYQRTEYQQSLALLLPEAHKDAPTLGLIGQNYFMLAEYKKATEAFEKAVAFAPNDSELHHWLGRAWGRRAETSNPFSAPGFASKARQSFEKAVALDPSNHEAVNDLFDYYLEAPGFLGGGLQKAEQIAALIAPDNPAEGNYAQAQIEDKRKEYDAAEQHLRRAAELAPKEVGRVMDVAMYLAKRGRYKESDAMFDEATSMAPASPKVWFERASAYIKGRRKLGEAKELLERYLRSPLTPDDPPRERAEELLKKIGA